MQTKERVREFWSRNVNQFNQLNRDDVGSPEFYAAAERLRFQYHDHLPPLFDRIAKEFPGGRLLEVGCSMGNDSVQLARRGMNVVGVDLTERAIELVKLRFDQEGLRGEFRVADAEQLPFEDGSFDVAYSFGVLHHTPNTPAAVREIHRVLRPGGKAFVMLYHRRSLNALAHRITGIPLDGSREDPCPVEDTYTARAARRLFQDFREVEIAKDYLFGTGWGIVNRLIPRFLHRSLGRWIGWHLMIEARR